MPKNVLLYTEIYGYTAIDFVRAVDDLEEGDDLVVRVNTPGGDPEALFCIIAKIQEYTGRKIIKVDGKADSAGAYLLCYTDEAECLDVSNFLFHRAAYWWEENYPDMMTAERKQTLVRINKHLRKAFESKVDATVFQQVTGVSVNELFSLDTRIDVELTAQQAKQIGLVDKIVKITPAKKKEVTALASSIGASLYDRVAAYSGNDDEATSPSNHPNKKMDINEIKAKHPDVYNAILAEGTEKEKARVEGWNAWNAIDAKAVEAGIASGKDITINDISKLQAKAATSKPTTEAPEAKKADDADKTVEALAAEAAAAKPGPTADAPTAEAKDDAVSAFREGWMKELNIKKQEA